MIEKIITGIDISKLLLKNIITADINDNGIKEKIINIKNDIAITLYLTIALYLLMFCLCIAQRQR
jgi:hypothetical protein